MGPEVPPRSGPAHALGDMDPRGLVAALLAYVLVVALAPATGCVRWCGLVLLLIPPLVAARVPLALIGVRLGLLTPFALLVVASIWLTPPHSAYDAWRVPAFDRSVSLETASRMGAALAGGGLSVVAVSIAGHAIGADGVARGLAGLGLPRVLSMLLVLTVRYVGLLRDEARRMVRARDARGGARGFARGARVAGCMVGSLFVRSLGRAERVSAAMLSRGFDGHLPSARLRRIRARDVLLAAGFALAAVAIARPWEAL